MIAVIVVAGIIIVIIIIAVVVMKSCNTGKIGAECRVAVLDLVLSRCWNRRLRLKYHGRWR